MTRCIGCGNVLCLCPDPVFAGVAPRPLIFSVPRAEVSFDECSRDRQADRLGREVKSVPVHEEVGAR
jgi:hypothetical protein